MSDYYAYGNGPCPSFMPALDDALDADQSEYEDELTPEQAKTSENMVGAPRKVRDANFPHTVRTDEQLLIMRTETRDGDQKGLPVSFKMIGKHLGCAERTAARRYTQLDDAIAEMHELGVKNRSPTHWIKNAKYEHRGKYAGRDPADDENEPDEDLEPRPREEVDCDDDGCLGWQFSEHSMRPSQSSQPSMGPSPSSESQNHNAIHGDKQAQRTARLYLGPLGSRNTLNSYQTPARRPREDSYRTPVKAEAEHEKRIRSRLEAGTPFQGRRRHDGRRGRQGTQAFAPSFHFGRRCRYQPQALARPPALCPDTLPRP